MLNPDGQRSVTKLPEADGPAWFRLEDWHEYHLTCIGTHLTLAIDGRLAAEVEDNDPRRRELQGILALQLHSGPPTFVQFKEIQLKVLKAATPASKPRLTAAGKKQASLRREALAWWPMDVGGHGAKPPLRHIPGWEKFELNVRAAGPGAHAGADVVVLDGAHFDGGPDLPGPTKALTVYLRARDPRGAWNAALFGKRAGPDQVHFNLRGGDSPATAGPVIGFEVGTERGLARVSFPVSQIVAAAWHDLVGRYDGKKLELFCDGRRLAGQPWIGTLRTNRAPLLIAAESEDGKVARHFRGELETAALWSRALTDREIAALSRDGTVAAAPR